MVEAEVWELLEEIPDPEIPVISLVDLGVIRSVDVSEGHVHIEFTPTFLGCPALEYMKRAIEEKVPGAEVQVIQDDSWSTDKITAAGREKLREAGFAVDVAAPSRRTMRTVVHDFEPDSDAYVEKPGRRVEPVAARCHDDDVGIGRRHSGGIDTLRLPSARPQHTLGAGGRNHVRDPVPG